MASSKASTRRVPLAPYFERASSGSLCGGYAFLLWRSASMSAELFRSYYEEACIRCISQEPNMLPMGSRSRRLLNQSTHSSVANSTASKLRHGPRRWITSAL